MTAHKIVSHEEWLAARKQHLVKEKELTRLHDQLARERRELPWVAVEKPYVFEGPAGKQTLSELFAGRTQLIVYHFMFGPGWKEGCPSCSLIADHLAGVLPHLVTRDVSFAAVSRAPYAEIAPFKQRMGWQFPWVSSHGSDFNRDYAVSFSKEEIARGEVYYNFGMNSFPSEEAPGLSVFCKRDDGALFHTYSTYGRGGESVLGVYQLLDMVPKGRDESGLPFPMAWVRHHDNYGHMTPA